jgi:uncharacterized protein YhaN
VKICDIHVADFGAWHDLQLTDLAAGATVFYGPNEAGKTTLLNFVRSILYGYAPKRCERYLPPARGSRAGGQLHVAAPHGRFILERFADARYQGGPGDLAIRTPDGKRQGNHLLQSLLGGVDETIFNNVFAVGLSQLQQLGSLSDTEAAQQLYGLATGSDRVSLFDVLRSLKARQTGLLAADRTHPGEIDRLSERRERLEREVQALRDENRRWFEWLADQEKLRTEIQQLEATQQQLSRHGNWNEVAEKLQAQWVRARQLDQQLRGTGSLPDIPAHIQKRVHELSGHIRNQRQQWEALRDQRRQLKAKASEQQHNAPLWQHAAEIEAIDRQRGRILALQAEVVRSEKLVEQLDFELQAELAQLGLQSGTGSTGLANLSIAAIETLRGPARETQQLAVRVEAAKKVHEANQQQLRSIEADLQSARSRFGGEEIVTALERTANESTQLRRRMELDDQRERLGRELDDCEEQIQFWLRRQVLPWNGVLTVCAIFSAGAMLFLTGLCGDWFRIAEANSWMMMLVGGAVAALAFILKQAFESTASRQAAELQEKAEELRGQREQAVAEIDELQRALPSGSGNLVERLQEVDREYAQLKQLAPLARRRRAVADEAAATERQLHQMVEQLKDVRRRWKSGLISAGLPDSLLPEQIESITDQVGRSGQLRQRLLDAKRELEQRQQELTVIRDRIDQLLVIGEILDEHPTLEAQLDALVATLRTHSQASQIRADLRRRWDDLGRQQKRTAEAAARQLSMRRALLKHNGAKSLREFHQALRSSAAAAQMREQRGQLLADVSTILGALAPQRLEQLLEHDPGDEFANCLARIGRQLADGESRLRNLHERFGQLKQKVDNLTSDRVLARKQLELNVIDEEIGRMLETWTIAAAANLTLDAVRQTYERDRQPETLAEASGYLERLTEGRYTRVWTPFGESSLCIDDDKRKSLTVDKLSRGTREQVFLALRLALVTAYNRRGAAMPMVLDDVFVNFDNHRAQAAAEVLYDVTRAGHQLLVFTCHEHIKDIFEQLGADVRDLPLREGIQGRRVRRPVTLEADDATGFSPAVSPLVDEPGKVPGDSPSKGNPSWQAGDVELPAYGAEELPAPSPAAAAIVAAVRSLAPLAPLATPAKSHSPPQPRGASVPQPAPGATTPGSWRETPPPQPSEANPAQPEDPWLEELEPLGEWHEPDRLSILDEADELLYRS